MVGVWLTYSKQAQANPAYSFDFRLPCPLPNWHTPYRTDDQLRGMRATLESARTRVAADLEAFAGDEAAKGTLRGRLAAVDSTISQIEGLWTRDPDDALRGTIGDTLLRALDGANELGQLLARPDLIPRY